MAGGGDDDNDDNGVLVRFMSGVLLLPFEAVDGDANDGDGCDGCDKDRSLVDFVIVGRWDGLVT